MRPSDLPMGDNRGETRRMKLAPNARWHIHASSDDEDQDGNLINWQNHSPHLTESQVLEVIEEFFMHPDFVGFQPKEGEFPSVTENQDVSRLMEAIHRRFQSQQRESSIFFPIVSESQELQSIGGWEYVGWASNLPLNIKVLMAALLVTLLTAMAGGIYPATVNWDRATNWMDGTYQNLLESVTPFLDSFTQEEEDE